MRSTAIASLTLIAAAAALAPATTRAQEEPATEEGPYGRTPDELRPFRGVGEPDRRFFVNAPAFRGPGRDEPAPEGLTSVAVGLLAPIHGPDAPAGRHMQNAARLALDEANEAGGLDARHYGGRSLPFELFVRDESATWGAAGDAAVELVCDHEAWGLVGGYEDANSHVLTRVLVKLEVPNVNPAGVDTTIPEHNRPLLLRVRPSDRQTSYRLAAKVFTEDARERVVVLRANSRYGRTGTREFVDAARRLHKPILLEIRYDGGDYGAPSTGWAARMERIRAARPDAVVVWGRPAETGAAVRALRDAGIDCRVYGPDRLVSPELLKAAGAAAEGLIFTYPMDPRPGREPWDAFRDRYRERFGVEPDATAAFTYDATRLLVDAIRAEGLNRARILDALFRLRRVDGVSGPILFDTTQNNVAPVILGHVESGRFVFDG